MDQFFTNNQSSIVASNRILYTPSTFARSSLLHLQEIGELEAGRAQPLLAQDFSLISFSSLCLEKVAWYTRERISL